MHGSVTVRTPDGRYLWYLVEVRAAPPAAERAIELSAHVRAAALLEIEVANPSRGAVEFSVSLEGDGLLGEPTLPIGAGVASAKYSLMFSPLLAGAWEGAVSFVNPSAGQFWYQLRLTASQPAAEALGLLEVPLGQTGSHLVSIDNPLPEPLSLRAVSSSPHDWSVAAAAGGPLRAPPFGRLELLLQYAPCSLGVEAAATLQLVHPSLAPWEFAVRGLGLPPARMEGLEVSAELHALASVSATFVNPLRAPVTVGVALEAPPGCPDGLFALLARRTSGITVAPGARLQLPFSYEAADMTERHATLVVRSEAKPAGLVWEYPIVAYAESRPNMAALSLSVRARQTLQTMLELPLPGVGEAGGGFSAELQGVPQVGARKRRTERRNPSAERVARARTPQREAAAQRALPLPSRCPALRAFAVLCPCLGVRRPHRVVAAHGGGRPAGRGRHAALGRAVESAPSAQSARLTRRAAGARAAAAGAAHLAPRRPHEPPRSPAPTRALPPGSHARRAPPAPRAHPHPPRAPSARPAPHPHLWRSGGRRALAVRRSAQRRPARGRRRDRARDGAQPHRLRLVRAGQRLRRRRRLQRGLHL